MITLTSEVQFSRRRTARQWSTLTLRLLVGVWLIAFVVPSWLLCAGLEDSSLQNGEVQLKQKQFELDMERYDTANKHHVEQQRTFHEAIYVAAGLGILAAVMALLRARQVRRQQDVQAKLKAPEILFSASNGSSIKSKGRMLSSLFPKELGRFGLGSKEYSPVASPGRMELLRLLAANPQNHKQIVHACAVLFPDLQEDGELVTRLLQHNVES